VRRRARNLPRGQRHKSQVLAPQQGVLQQNPSTPAVPFAQIAEVRRARRETLSQIYAKQADAGQRIAKSKRLRLLLIRGYVIWHALLNRSFALALVL
jgi:hypothetical protein